MYVQVVVRKIVVSTFELFEDVFQERIEKEITIFLLQAAIYGELFGAFVGLDCSNLIGIDRL